MLKINLQHIQTHFQQFVLESVPEIKNHILETRSIDNEARLAIYQDGYYLRIIEALQQDYATLAALLGEERFTQLGRDYIQRCPSHFRSLRWYGKELANVMRQETYYQTRPYLIEMAEFEWLLMEAFDEQDVTPITLESMMQLLPEQWTYLRFKLHPSLRLLLLYWNVPLVWKTHTENTTQLAPKCLRHVLPWLIWRKEREVHFCSLTDDEKFMLDAILAGEDFASICAGLCEWIEEEKVAIHAASLLKRYILDGLVIQLT